MVHYWNVEEATGYGRWRCRRCSGEAVLKRKRRVRRLLLLEGGDRCQACGYDRLRKNLHFHHVDPRHKEFDLTSGNGKSLDRFRVEATKCVLVCANCHGEIEAGLRACPPTMTERVRAFSMQPVTLADLLVAEGPGKIALPHNMQWQADQEAARQAREGGDAKSDEETGPDETPSENGDGGERMVTHFSAWIEVDPVRAGREASTIADEVLSQFTDRGKRVKVTVEIEADDPEGFDENVRRVVTENAKTLGFGHHEFI